MAIDVYDAQKVIHQINKVDEHLNKIDDDLSSLDQLKEVHDKVYAQFCVSDSSHPASALRFAGTAGYVEINQDMMVAGLEYNKVLLDNRRTELEQQLREAVGA